MFERELGGLRKSGGAAGFGAPPAPPSPLPVPLPLFPPSFSYLTQTRGGAKGPPPAPFFLLLLPDHLLFHRFIEKQ